jgi:hypothetical protein
MEIEEYYFKSVWHFSNFIWTIISGEKVHNELQEGNANHIVLCRSGVNFELL